MTINSACRTSGARISPTRSIFLSSFLLVCALASLACPIVAAAAEPGVYTVRRGDFLTRIASRCGVTLSELRRANNLSGDLIRPGQKLTIPNPLHRFGGNSLDWRRPHTRAAGRRLQGFGPVRNDHGVTVPHSGVDIALPKDTRIVSPATGVVRYVGSQDGYGLLLIIEHAAGYTTVLGPFARSSLAVAVDDLVLRGDTLGRTGDPVEHVEPYLHVELRRRGQAIDPARLLR